VKRIKSYKTFERALPDNWLEENPDNYLTSDASRGGIEPRKEQGSENLVEDMKILSWEDINVEPGFVSAGDRWNPRPGEKTEEYLCKVGDLNLIRFVVHSSNLNRIHTDTALPDEYRNIGLGYKCYKAIINKLGWVRSDKRASNKNSRSIWKRLIKDNDYYTFVISNTVDVMKQTGTITMWSVVGQEANDGFVVFNKSENRKHIKEILKKIKSDGYSIKVYDPNFKNIKKD